MSKITIASQNPTGILAAVLLEKAGHEVTLLDSGAGTFNSRSVPYEVVAVPSETAAFDALAQLEAALDLQLVAGEKEAAPIYFDGTDPKPFLGFGETKFTSVAPLSTFNFSKSLALTQDLSVAVQRAHELFKGKILPYTEVVKVEFGSDRVEHLVLSSAQNIEADFYVFCDSPRAILNMIPADVVNSRWRGRMLKTPVWTRVKIHFQHTQPICAPELLERSIYLIPGGTTQEPFAGQIFSGPDGVRSVWQSYVNEEMGEDPELISSTIKHMRRQLQRVFNVDEFRKENLLMAEPEAYGDFSWAREATTGLEEDVENATLGSPLLSQFNGLMGCVEQARRIFLKVTEPRQKRSKEPSILAENTASC